MPVNTAGGIFAKMGGDGAGFCNMDSNPNSPGLTAGVAGPRLVTVILNCRLYTRVLGKMLNVTGE